VATTSRPVRGGQRDADGVDALPAAARHAVFVGRGALAEAAVGDGQQNFLGRLQFGEPLGREGDDLATASSASSGAAGGRSPRRRHPRPSWRGASRGEP
jgi:hypothetical protein